MATAPAPSVAEEFRAFIMNVCGAAPDHVVADGRWHSFRMADTRHKGSRPGRYLLHNDERPVGWVMDWRDEKVRHRWFGSNSGETIDRAEIARRRDARAMERLRAFQNAADEAVEFWKTCKPLSELHPYLERKGVLPYRTRQGSGARFGLGDAPCVIIPIIDAEGRPLTLQAIREDGERRFWPGSTHEGGHHLIGQDDGQSPVLFAEGYSTAATLHAATGFPVVMTINTSNMAHVARWASHRWAGRDMIVAGDDDWHLVDHPKVKRNVGKEAAEAMARALGGRVIMPDMCGLDTQGGDDFNDMAREFGLQDVTAHILNKDNAAPAPAPLPLIWFDENKPLLSGNWLIKNVLPAEAFCTIIGHPGCGKSFFALDLACHIAAGLKWQDRKVKQGLVLYIAAEGQRGQQNRVEAWKRHYEAQGLAFAMIPVAINLGARTEDLPKLFETIQAACAIAGVPLAALVIDTLNRTFGGGDENGTDMSEYVANIGKVQTTFGCTAIVVHHIPKNSETVSERGHGSLRGAIETSLVVSSDAESGLRTVLCKKQKDAEDGWKLNFKLKVIELGEDEDGDPVTSCVVVPADAAEASKPAAKGPRLNATQRQALNELQATLQAHRVGLPDDFPIERRGNMASGLVTSRKVFKDRWKAIAAGDKTDAVADATFRRVVTDLQNLGLVGAWNDFIWAVQA
ncbi:AAA family ATPase [Sphingomonas melonis]|uniref:AAA family ATPase n=1 Tax=Sphingomonas melonis TaxID=152682 RepID=UPI003693421B